ncbi:hypothetical protein BU16DRAFT_71634 [Lophium mytilinum]|uniref:Uncharacterized protein n=1 Tax=Lophium mytilinum TaxID=390894 RepID=A0A6A6QLV5_9PEZI|nr:hypothetical protein BU16DRAFT_71634 [Lophium mytilinum]
MASAPRSPKRPLEEGTMSEEAQRSESYQKRRLETSQNGHLSVARNSHGMLEPHLEAPSITINDLPNELLDRIIELLAEQFGLHNSIFPYGQPACRFYGLLLTSKLFHDIAVPHAYKSYHIFPGLSRKPFLYAMVKTPQLGAHLKMIKVEQFLARDWSKDGRDRKPALWSDPTPLVIKSYHNELSEEEHASALKPMYLEHSSLWLEQLRKGDHSSRASACSCTGSLTGNSRGISHKRYQFQRPCRYQPIIFVLYQSSSSWKQGYTQLLVSAGTHRSSRSHVPNEGLPFVRVTCSQESAFEAEVHRVH